MTARDADAQKQVPPREARPPRGRRLARPPPRPAPRGRRCARRPGPPHSRRGRARGPSPWPAGRVRQPGQADPQDRRGRGAVRRPAAPLRPPRRGGRAAGKRDRGAEGQRARASRRGGPRGSSNTKPLEVLRKHGVERVDAAGRLFDPQVHEAISEFETDAPERKVLHVLSPGFTLHRTARPGGPRGGQPAEGARGPRPARTGVASTHADLRLRVRGLRAQEFDASRRCRTSTSAPARSPRGRSRCARSARARASSSRARASTWPTRRSAASPAGDSGSSKSGSDRARPSRDRTASRGPPAPKARRAPGGG